MNNIKLILIFILICISQSMDAQSWRPPDCRDLEITKVVWSPNSTDTLLITVFNHCDTCSTPVYNGFIAHQAGDTLAVTNPWNVCCVSTPPNNDHYEYALVKIKDFEINSQIRFEMIWGICDSISYADNLFLDTEATKDDIPITIYPNPTQDIAYLKIPIGLTIHSIKLLDVQGKTLLELDKNTTQFSMKNYANGMYIITIDTNKGLISRKINIIK